MSRTILGLVVLSLLATSLLTSPQPASAFELSDFELKQSIELRLSGPVAWFDTMRRGECGGPRSGQSLPCSEE